MESPTQEIASIIHSLTQSPPSTQRSTIEKYYTPDASFAHPFCRTGSFRGSRWLVWCVYRWYKILSPRVEVMVDSVAFDEQTLLLYVTLHQVFRLWIIPFYVVPVSLTTRLQLVTTDDATTTTTTTPTKTKTKNKPLYYIKSQHDLYEVSQFIKFVLPFGGSMVVMGLQFASTAVCVVFAWLFWPVTWVEENVVGGNRQRGAREIVG